MRFVTIRNRIGRLLMAVVVVFVSVRGASAAPTFVYALNQVSGGANQTLTTAWGVSTDTPILKQPQ